MLFSSDWTQVTFGVTAELHSFGPRHIIAVRSERADRIVVLV